MSRKKKSQQVSYRKKRWSIDLLLDGSMDRIVWITGGENGTNSSVNFRNTTMKKKISRPNKHKIIGKSRPTPQLNLETRVKQGAAQKQQTRRKYAPGGNSSLEISINPRVSFAPLQWTKQSTRDKIPAKGKKNATFIYPSQNNNR